MNTAKQIDRETKAALNQMVKRENAKLADIARATGLNPSWLSMYRNGNIDRPGLYQVFKLREYLGLS